MCVATRPHRRNGFTLIEMLVVMALILVIFALGVGYAVFGQSNQHSYTGANAITGALLNAKQRARRDGVPTGVRILFTNTTDANNNPAVWASQLQLVQQPGDYNAGQIVSPIAPGAPQVSFTGVDFQGGAAYLGQAQFSGQAGDEATILAGDYFLLTGPGNAAHLITQVAVDAQSNQALNFSPTPPPPFPPASSPNPATSTTAIPPGTPYVIHRGPRRLASEDMLQLPPSVVIDNSVSGGTTLCQNLPIRTVIDYGPTMSQPTPVQFAEIVFAPSGAVVGQGTGADKILLWLRDPTQLTPVAGAPLIVSVQIRTGLISVYQVAPGNDPYAYAKDGRASGS